MAYDEGLAQRIREELEGRDDLPHPISEKKMFGGLAFLLGGNMCVGVNGENLMARVGPDSYQKALSQSHAREMDFTKRPLRGFVYVDADGVEADRDLARWIDRCVEFARTLAAK